MHELGVAESILTLVLEAAAGRNVKSIRLKVGKLQHITPDSLKFSYDLLAEETTAARTEIHIEPIPVVIRCLSCAAENEAQGPPFRCATCESLHVEIESGDEIILESIELEDGTSIRRRQ